MDTAPDQQPTTEPIERVLLDLTLAPHRSLDQRGLTIVMALISLVSFGAGLVFFLIGAWPVVGFLGLDVALIYVALKVNLNRARASETLRLTDSALVIERVSHRGQRRALTLQPYWLNVHLDDPPEHHSHVWLRSHGRSVAVGMFLPPDERVVLADRLREALRRLREPAVYSDRPSTSAIP
jgi:uncharacterized membrane protein